MNTEYSVKVGDLHHTIDELLRRDGIITDNQLALDLLEVIRQYDTSVKEFDTLRDAVTSIRLDLEQATEAMDQNIESACETMVSPMSLMASTELVEKWTDTQDTIDRTIEAIESQGL